MKSFAVLILGLGALMIQNVVMNPDPNLPRELVWFGRLLAGICVVAAACVVAASERKTRD